MKNSINRIEINNVSNSLDDLVTSSKLIDNIDFLNDENYKNENSNLFGSIKHIYFMLENNKYETLDDLIILGNSYYQYIKNNRKKRRRTFFNNVDLYKLNIIIPDIIKLNNMIGMESLKKDIVYQLLYFLSGMNTYNDLMHTVILGSPGCGKTELAKIIANIYIKLGFLSRGHITFAKRSDLIAEYLGQTAVKTQKLLNSCKGGCLILDEAYSLGNSEKRDSYSKECIDTINQFLLENKDDFVCIIIGYEKELKECFFNQNSGLERRFSWKYKIDPYNNLDIMNIFKSQIKLNNWKLELNSINKELFDTTLFNNYGGDTDLLFTKCKMSHVLRIFGNNKSKKKVLTKEDIEKGMILFKKHKNKNKNNLLCYNHLYM